MKEKYCVIFCLLFQISGFSQSAQQMRIDSLRKALPALNHAARVDCLNELAKEHWSLSQTDQKDSMYHYAVLANREAAKIAYPYGRAMSLLWMAEYELFAKSNRATAEAYINEAIEIGENIKNNSLLGRAYLSLGSLYMGTRDTQSKLKYFKKSRDFFEKAGDKEGELEVTTWLCMSYADAGKYEEVFDYCDKCVKLSKSITQRHSRWHHELVQWSFLNMAALYDAAGDYQTSMQYTRQCAQYARVNNLPWDMDLALSENFINLASYDSALFYWRRWEKDYEAYGVGHQAYGNNVLAEIYLNTGQYDDAIKILESSIATFRKGNKDIALLRSLLFAAQIHVKRQNWTTALKYATEGLGLAEKEKIRPSVIDGHKLLSEIYHAIEKYDKAYNNLKQYTILKDSVLNRQFLWRLNSYKKAAEDAKKKASIELLYKDNVIKDEQLKQENILKNVLIAGLLTLMLVSFFIFRALKMKQKNERRNLKKELILQKLESDKRHAELRQRAVELEMQALRAQMSPHFIFNCLSSINRFILKNESGAASDYLTRFSRLIRLVLSNSKKTLVSLEEELEMVRLYIEMERLRFKDSFDFHISFRNEIDTSTILIPPLLLQPFAENAIWHGLMNKVGDGELEISFSVEENILTCIIRDNGVGRVKAIELKSKMDVKRKSMGLQITRDRLAQLSMERGGNTFFEIEDLYDEQGNAEGTRVILKIRLEHAFHPVLAEKNNYA